MRHFPVFLFLPLLHEGRSHIDRPWHRKEMMTNSRLNHPYGGKVGQWDARFGYIQEDFGDPSRKRKVAAERRPHPRSRFFARGLSGSDTRSAFTKYNRSAAAGKPPSAHIVPSSGEKSSNGLLVGSGVSAFRPVVRGTGTPHEGLPSSPSTLRGESSRVSGQPAETPVVHKEQQLTESLGPYRPGRTGRRPGQKDSNSDAFANRSAAARETWKKRKQAQAVAGPPTAEEAAKAAASRANRAAASRRVWEARRQKAPGGIVTVHPRPDTDPGRAWLNRSQAQKKVAEAKRLAKAQRHAADKAESSRRPSPSDKSVGQ